MHGVAVQLNPVKTCIGLFLVRFFDARSLALFSDIYISNVIDIAPHLAMGDDYLAYIVDSV